MSSDERKIFDAILDLKIKSGALSPNEAIALLEAVSISLLFEPKIPEAERRLLSAHVLQLARADGSALVFQLLHKFKKDSGTSFEESAPNVSRAAHDAFETAKEAILAVTKKYKL